MKKQIIIFLALFIFIGLFPFYKTQAASLATKLEGRILLQVESHGEAWYVNPKDDKRYYMADGTAAYDIMRNLGVGITDKNLNRIKSDLTFAKKQQGKIFLQVESRGEAYYIDTNGQAHYLADGAAAYSIMRELGLGIKTSDLEKITLSDKDAMASTTPADVSENYDLQISSSTCKYTTVADNYGNVIKHIRAIVQGTVQGPVGARVELPDLIWSDDKWYCGDWTYSPGALIAVGGTCTRQAGQPAMTEWTVDTGGEEQGDWLMGKLLSYTAKIYAPGAIIPEKQSTGATNCQ